MKPIKQNQKKQQTVHREHQNLPVLFVFILVAWTFLLYFQTIRADYVLDDVFVTTENRFVQKGISGIGDIFTHGYFKGYNEVNNQLYRPFIVTVFAVETEIFGNNPRVNHFFNIFYYALASVLLFFLLVKLLKKTAIVTALMISLLFIAHPVHTEVVSNIKSRDEIIAFIFLVSSLIFLFRYVETEKIRSLIPSLLFSLLCVLTKESGITLVAIIPLTLFFFTRFSFKKIAVITLPFLFIMGVYLVIRNGVLDPFHAKEDTLFILNNSLLGAKNPEELLATNFVILGLYLKLLVIPYPLSWDYSYNQIPITHVGDLKAILSFGIYLALGIYALIRIRKKDLISYCIFFYVITLSVSSNLIIKIGSTFGERFLFTPSLGFCIALILLLDRLFRKVSIPRMGELKFLYIPVSILLTGYGIMTYARTNDWKTNLSLFQSGVKVCPNSAKTHFALAGELAKMGYREKNPAIRNRLINQAIQSYLRSIKILPEYSVAWYYLGSAYYQQNKKDSALIAFRKTTGMVPWHKDAWIYLSMIYSERNEWDQALECYHQLLKFDKNDSKTLGNIGVMHQNTGDYKTAITFFNRAIRADSNNLFVYRNLITLLNYLGETDQARMYEELAKSRQR